MYITVTTAGGNQPAVFVLGERLKREEEGYFLLPGRLIHALKPDDLPIGIGFSLDGPLPCGYGLYQEDRVVFQRKEACSTNTLWVEVISTYLDTQWDGLFPLDVTLLSREQFLKKQQAFTGIRYESAGGVSTIRYAFVSTTPHTYDLEQAMEAICDTVFEVEAKGNLRLWHGDTWREDHE